jgi:predicted MFS family arabinose efflux permease
VKATALRRNRDYLLLSGGQTVSVLGSQASKVAYPLLVLAMTGSAAKAGVAGATASGAYLLFPLLAGVLADRLNRKLIMVACDLVRLAALSSIAVAAIAGRLGYGQVLVASFCEGTASVLFTLALRGSVPMLVEKSQRSQALAQTEARTYGAQVAGPAVGGALFGLSRTLPFAFDALTYLASLATLPFIRRPLQQPATEPTSLRRELADGLAWTWQRPFLRTVAILGGALNLFLAIFTLAIIVLARDDGASSAMTGAIIGCMGVGGLAGAFIAPAVQTRFRPGLVITVILWGTAALTLALAGITSPPWMCPFCALLGFLMPMWNVAVQTYRMRITPNHLLARVTGVNLQIAWGVLPLGSLLGGVLLSTLPGTGVMVLTATGMTAVAVAATVFPAVRRAGGDRDQYAAAAE